jgi:hypothetical protein
MSLYFLTEELVDKALITADSIRKEMGFFNKDLSKQILSQISEGLTSGQIKTQSEETRKVLRHGSAVRKQEVQNQEAAVKRHATEHTGKPRESTGQTIISPRSSRGQSSRGSTPKTKQPRSQACSVM